jgi:hypothetical protein
MNNKDLQEKLNQQVKNIKQEGNITLVELEDGTTLPLIGGISELKMKIPSCNFCGKDSSEVFLYTKDDETYICKDCTIQALEAFGSNGLTIDLNLSKISPQLAEKLISNDNIDIKKDKVKI